MITQRMIARHVVQIGPGARLGECVQHNLRNACLRPIGHEQNTVREQNRLIHIMRDHEAGLLGFADQPCDLILKRAARQRIKRRERLIHQQHFRIDGECAGNANALLHAAGKLCRFAVCGVVKAHALQGFTRSGITGSARPIAMAAGNGEGDIARGRHPRHQRMALKHHGAIKRWAGDGLAIHNHRAIIRRFKPGQDIQDGGLAAARMPNQADEFATCDAEPDILENSGRPIAARDTFDGNIFCHGFIPARPQHARQARATGQAQAQPARS